MRTLVVDKGHSSHFFINFAKGIFKHVYVYEKNLTYFLFALSLMAVLPQRMSAAANIEIIDNDFQQITVTVTSAGVLHVTGANGYVLQVYNVLGVRVASIKVEGNDKRIDLPLKSGCYIVKVGNVVRKISINR